MDAARKIIGITTATPGVEKPETPSSSTGDKPKPKFYEGVEDIDEREKWAQLNKNNGFWSMILATGSWLLGASDLIGGGADGDSNVHRFTKLAKEVSLRVRGHLQYDIYRQKNDDLGDDESRKPISAGLGQIACFVERFVNPVVLPASTLIGDNFLNGLTLLTTLPNNLWWRSRPFEEGIKWKETFSKETWSHVKNLFSGDDWEKREEARINVRDRLQPVLGLYGFFTMAIFTPLKAINKFKGETSKFIDFFTATSFVSQHLMYFVKYTLDDLHKSKVKNLEGFGKLFHLGVVTNAMNLVSPLVKLLPAGEGLLGRLISDFENLPFTAHYFAARRWLRGDYESRRIDAIKNPERQSADSSEIAFGSIA